MIVAKLTVNKQTSRELDERKSKNIGDSSNSDSGHCPELFWKNVVLKNFVKFIGKCQRWSLFFDEVAAPPTCNFK